jgi:hypothetical protein
MGVIFTMKKMNAHCISFGCSLNPHSRYESIIATLCENLDTLDEPEAKVNSF